jgi:hypothetical protein
MHRASHQNLERAMNSQQTSPREIIGSVTSHVPYGGLDSDGHEIILTQESSSNSGMGSMQDMFRFGGDSQFDNQHVDGFQSRDVDIEEVDGEFLSSPCGNIV